MKTEKEIVEQIKQKLENLISDCVRHPMRTSERINTYSKELRSLLSAQGEEKKPCGWLCEDETFFKQHGEAMLLNKAEGFQKPPIPVYFSPFSAPSQKKPPEETAFINLKEKKPDYYRLVVCNIEGKTNQPVLCWRASDGDGDIWSISGSDWLVTDEIIEWYYFQPYVIAPMIEKN